MAAARWPAKPAWLRVVRETAEIGSGFQVTSPRDVADTLRAHGTHLEEQEVFYVILLDAKNQIRGLQEVSRGILNSSLVHPREVFRLAVVHGAASIIVAHNHPTGDPRPSADDKAITKQLVEAGEVLGIPVYDHVIVAAERYFSFQEAGLV